MNKHCTKCNCITNDEGDIHCLKLFINEIKKCADQHNFPSAFNFYVKSLSKFDKSVIHRILSKQGGEIGKQLMGSHCSVCGIPTLENDDLHCMKKFVEKIGELINQGDIELTTNYYRINRKKFNTENIDNLLLNRYTKIGQEIIDGYKIMPTRITHCFSCDRTLVGKDHEECRTCGWIICKCGSCGCNYSVEK